MKTIEIDLDVYRVIESGRMSFEETPNAIVRRLLAIDPKPRSARSEPMARSTRSSGAYSTVIGESPIEANSLKELLRRVILLANKLQPGFIGRLAAVPTARGRYVVASAPEELYPKSPQLLDYAERLDPDWWFDTNVGRTQVQAYLRIFAGMLKLPQVPAIQKRSEKSTLSLKDLGLD